MKNKLILLAVTFTAAILYSVPIFAQPTPPSAPVDGGLSLLVAGGVGYGLKKMRDKKKKQEEENQAK